MPFLFYFFSLLLPIHKRPQIIQDNKEEEKDWGWRGAQEWTRGGEKDERKDRKEDGNA